MKRTSGRHGVLALALLGIAPSSAVARAGDEGTGYTFREPPVNSLGVKGMADLRGKPVLIAFWGTRSPASVGESVPASIQLQTKHGEDLQVIFVECEGADLDKSEAFAWRQKWMGTRAMWTTERPLEVEGDGLPRFALLDVEGKLLLHGNPLEQRKEIEAALAEQLERASDPPEGTLPMLRKPWARFVKGDIAGALEECDELGTDVMLNGPAHALRDEIMARVKTRIARGQWLFENGYLAEATEAYTDLAKDVEGSELERQIDGVLRSLRAPAIASAPEVVASKALASLEQKMIKGKPFDDGNVQALLKLAEKHAGTKAGARAAHLAKLAKLEP